jgi:hypothetical protein
MPSHSAKDCHWWRIWDCLLLSLDCGQAFITKFVFKSCLFEILCISCQLLYKKFKRASAVALTLNICTGFSLFGGGGGGFGSVCWGTALPDGGSRVRFAMVSLEIFIDLILPSTMSSQPLKINEFLELTLSSPVMPCGVILFICP